MAPNALSPLSPPNPITPAPPPPHAGTAGGGAATPARDSFARALDQASSTERGVQHKDERAEERATDAAAKQAASTPTDPAATAAAAAAATALAAAAPAAGKAAVAEAAARDSTKTPEDPAALLAGWLNWSPARGTLPAPPKDGAHSTAGSAPVAAAADAPAAGRTRPVPGAGSARAGDARTDAAAPAPTEPVPLRADAAPAPPPPQVNPLPAAASSAGLPGAGAATPAFEGRLPASPGSVEFAPQLGTQLSMFVREGIQHARLHLHPAEMGPLTVQIQLDGGAAQVHLAAEHPLTRQALEQAMPSLAGALREAGLTLTGGGVFERPRDAQPQPERRPGGGSGGRDGPPDALLALLPAAPATAMRRGVVDLIA